MTELFKQGGPMMWPLVVVLVVAISLAARTARHLARRNGGGTAVVQNGLDGLLFWGLLGLLFGVLGTVIGLFRGLMQMAAHGLRSPQALWTGLAESLVPTIGGFVALAAAGSLWFALRLWFTRRTSP